VAKPTNVIERKPVDQEMARETGKNELLDLLLERKASLEALIELVEKLDERGILALLNGLVGKGDEILGVVMHELNKPSTSAALSHLLSLGTLISRIEAEKLEGLAERVNRGIEKAITAAESDHMMTFYDLLKMFKDPDVNRVLSALFGFLKGIGSSDTKEES